MYRVVIITEKEKKLISKNFDNKKNIDNFLLEIAEKEGLYKYRIKDLKTGEIIETEKGVKK